MQVLVKKQLLCVPRLLCLGMLTLPGTLALNLKFLHLCMTFLRSGPPEPSDLPLVLATLSATPGTHCSTYWDCRAWLVPCSMPTPWLGSQQGWVLSPVFRLSLTSWKPPQGIFGAT